MQRMLYSGTLYSILHIPIREKPMIKRKTKFDEGE